MFDNEYILKILYLTYEEEITQLVLIPGMKSAHSGMLGTLNQLIQLEQH